MFTKDYVHSDIFKAIMHSIHNGIVVIDKSGNIVVFNKSAEKITGIKQEEALACHITKIIPNTGLLDILETGSVQVGEKIVINNSTCVTNRAPIFYNSKIWGAVGVFHDITDLEKITSQMESYRHMVEELEKLKSELELIVESSNDGLYITDGEGITLRVNSTYEEITGISADEVVGRHMKELVDEGYFSDSVTLHVLAQSTPRPVTLVQSLRNGRYVISTGRPVFSKDGIIDRVITNVRDVSHFLKLEEELEKARNVLERYQQEAEHLRLEHMMGEDVIVKSKKMIHVLEMTKQVARYPTTVIITGESGVGKEVIAKLIRQYSNRKEGPFIKVNCGAIPENLLESELFGYEAGAFTGASKKGKPGMIELADSGTLFLDEISELVFDLQVKLLRVIQDQEVTRLGGTSSRKIDVRFVAATNRNLLEMVENKHFRADLYYRLNVVRIDIPPLRERKEAIPSFLRYFLNKFCKEYQLKKEFSTDVVQLLCRYSWPGNVRELENLIENLVVMVKDDTILLQHLPDDIDPNRNGKSDIIFLSKMVPLRQAVNEVEKQLIQLSLMECGSIRKAAKALNVAHSTLLRKMSQLDIMVRK